MISYMEVILIFIGSAAVMTALSSLWRSWLFARDKGKGCICQDDRHQRQDCPACIWPRVVLTPEEPGSMMMSYDSERERWYPCIDDRARSADPGTE